MYTVRCSGKKAMKRLFTLWGLNFFARTVHLWWIFIAVSSWKKWLNEYTKKLFKVIFCLNNTLLAPTVYTQIRYKVRHQERWLAKLRAIVPKARFIKRTASETSQKSKPLSSWRGKSHHAWPHQTDDCVHPSVGAEREHWLASVKFGCTGRIQPVVAKVCVKYQAEVGRSSCRTSRNLLNGPAAPHMHGKKH